MFQSFTGSSRRPRQVNLSGRTSNPFAQTQTPFATRPPGGGSNALQHAQLERKARQQERERVNAARSIQRVWRGHQDRERLRTRRREALEGLEEQLQKRDAESVSLEDAETYIRLALYAVKPSLGDDWVASRILYMGRLIIAKSQQIVKSMDSDGHKSSWVVLLRSFAKLVSRSLGAALFPAPSKKRTGKKASTSSDEGKLEEELDTILAVLEAKFPNFKEQVQCCFQMLASVLTLMDSWNEIDWSLIRLDDPRAATQPARSRPHIGVLECYYRFVARMSKLDWLSTGGDEQRRLWNSLAPDVFSLADLPTLASLVGAPFATLSRIYGGQRGETVYREMSLGLMTTPELGEEVLAALKSLIDTECFFQQAQQAAIILKERTHPELQHQQQYLLANTIRMSSLKQIVSVVARDDKKPVASVNIDFLKLISSTLAMFGSVDELDPHTVSQLRGLTDAETIADLFRRSSLDDGTQNEERAQEADALSDYILNILRLLPSQADEVRLMLYMSHKRHANSTQKSAVRYFWDAVAETSLFKRGVKSWPDVRSLVRKPLERHYSEWKVIILFIEIYTFALRFQSDDEFIGGLSAVDKQILMSSSTLTFDELQSLVEFLKNLAYYLLLKNTPIDNSEFSVHPPTDSTSISLGGEGNAKGVNIQQLKESGVALLRMLYERDSRRKFLPAGSFLMPIDEVESQSFIGTVMREIVLKEKLDEEGSSEEEDEEESSMDVDDESYISSRDRTQGVLRSHRIQQIERQGRREQTQRLAARRRARQEAAPRVELLENTPFLVPFETRVQLFRLHVESDMSLRRGGDPDPERWRLGLHMNQDVQSRNMLAAHQAELHRESIFEDAFQAFDQLGEGLKEPIRISFIGEEGIDGGGVTKEFLTSVINDVFRVDSRYQLFSENDDHMLYPNPSVLDEAAAELDEIESGGLKITAQERAAVRRRILGYFRFAGRLVGKCLYEGILVDIPLARFFVTKWALTGGDGAAPNETTYRPTLNDMWDYDKAIYRGLLNVQSSKEDVSTWGMTFAVDDKVAGKTVERELKLGGSEITVNNRNKIEYVSRMVNYYLMRRQHDQTRAFLEGLSSIIKATWLRMFNEAEIRVLLGGESRPIDVEDLRHNTHYSGVYAIGDDGQEHATIRMFWEIMHEMEDSDRRKLLQYVTSTPNAPLMGFAHLNPRFSIRDSQSDQGRLPTSSTCANLLKLPIYHSKEVLRDRITTAIHSGAGFDLS